VNSGRRRSLYDRFLKRVPQQPRSQSLVDAILTAALERIAGSGNEEALTVQQVAARAGVSMGSLYDYFSDRESLLNAAMTKLAEDNLAAFRAVLARTPSMSLEEAVGTMADFVIETYASDRARLRAVIRLTTRLGLMPVLANAQLSASRALAETLEARRDVDVDDVQAAAWTITQSMMGIVMMLIWQEPPPVVETVRASAVAIFTAALANAGGNRTIRGLGT
jgi:AcrR family transcriptional regulator